MAPLTVQRISNHPEYYSKEFIYHHPRVENDGSYELTTRTLNERHGLISPTVPRSARLRLDPSHPVVLAPPTLHAISQFSGQASPRPVLDVILPTGRGIYGQANNPQWPPVSFDARKSHTHHPTKSSATPSAGLIGNNNQKLDSACAQTAYQTIDSHLVPGLHTPFRSRVVGRTSRVGRSSEQLELDESVTALLLTKPNASDTDSPYASGKALETKLIDGQNTGQRSPGKLQRTNSERSAYFQTSFV